LKLYLFVSISLWTSTILALFCNFAFPICQRTLVSQMLNSKIKIQNSKIDHL
jgi:hypothetical protein